jgi:hypothetical protein
MGLGSKRKRRSIYFCNLRATDENKKTDPHFSVSYTKDNVKQLLRETELSGKLYRLAIDGYDYKGIPQRTVVIEFVDGDDLFKLEVNIESSMTRNIVNSILGREPKGYNEIVFFRTYVKTKADGSFAQIYVGGESKGSGWDWKYTPADVEPLIVPFNNPKTKKVEKDYTALNDQLLKEFEDLAKRINGTLQANNKLEGEDDDTIKADATAPAPIDTLQNNPVGSTANTPGPENSTDDLPF